MEYTGYSGPKQPGFVFGGDTGISHSQLQTKRRIAEAMAANMAGRTPQNVGEGLTAIGDALRYRRLMKSIDKGEAHGQSKAKELIAAAMAGREPKPFTASTGPMTLFGPQPPARTPEQEIGDDTMAALGKDDAMSTEGRIVKGLTDRGLPEHVAQGFVMNFRDESGLNPGINEIEPLVPGSRGGFGLAQWTGPRRRQLEAFAAERGAPVDDMDLQMDFLVQELQGTEANAGRTILSTRNRSEAAQAIVNDFLRPAEEHRARRAAQYGGATPEPQQSDYSKFYAAFASPWLSQEQKTMLMAELEDRKAADNRAYVQWQQQNDPMRQLQLQKAQLELERMQNPQPGFSMLTPEQEAAMGLDPAGSYQRGADGKISQIGGGGTNVSVMTGNGAAIPDYPRAPDGFMYVRDPDTGQVVLNEQGIATMAPIIGGPEDTSQADAKADQVAAQTEATRSSVVVDTVNEIRETLKKDGLFDLPEVGVIGSKLKYVNQESADMAGMLETLKGMVVFDRLEQLKKASATGASGLGQVTEKEIDLLGAQLGALKQDMSKERIEATLDTIENVFGKLSPEAEAYLTGRSEALPSGSAPGRMAPSAPNSDYSTMDVNALNAVDIDTLTPTQQEALSRRYQELGY